MKKISRFVGLILIIVGLGIVFNAVYKKMETQNKQNSLIEQFNNLNDTSDSGEVLDERLKEVKVIAILEIPSIKLSQGIVEGTEDEILQYYIGHFEETVAPGEKGNFALAGHSYSDFSEAFINLKDVEIDDEVIVKTREAEFTYKINDTFVVTPDVVSVLDDTEDETITLITCTPGAKERLVLKGNLISKKEI